MTIKPSPTLPGYDEVIEWIGMKRPDLFDPRGYGEMRKNVLIIILPAAVLLAMAGIGFAITVQTDDMLPLVIFAGFGVMIGALSLFSPISATIDGQSLFIRYIFSGKTLPANAVRSIEMKFQNTRNGKPYFVKINYRGKIRALIEV